MDVPILLVGDDLTGAAEAAAAFAARTPRIIDLRTARDLRDLHRGSVVAVDTDSRYATPPTAADRLATALALLPPGGIVVKKLDSTLRGPLAAELGALRSPGVVLVVAPALPALGRTVMGGAVLIDGVPLERSAAWAAEPLPAPASLAEALAPLPVSVVGLPVVRGGVADLVAALLAAADGDRVAVCDTETEEDLDRIVAAGELLRRSGRPVRWAGSAGLAHALARAHGVMRAESPGEEAAGAGSPPPVSGGGAGSPLGPILFVVGTAAPAAREQLSWLARHVDTVVELDPGRLELDDPGTIAREIADRTGGRTAAVHLPDARGAARSQSAVAALAGVVAPAARDHPALVLTGGETARAVLAALGVGELHVREAWDDGVVVSTIPGTAGGGRVVVTKPGAFGDPAALVRIAQRLRTTRWHLIPSHDPQVNVSHTEDT